MSAPPRISDAEWLVMEAIWGQAPRSAGQIAEEVGPANEWSEATVKTMLARLVKKGALDLERDGKRYLYRAAVPREACVRSEAREFQERMFGGRTSPLLAWFVKESPLSDTEIEELRALLDEKAGQDEGGQA